MKPINVKTFLQNVPLEDVNEVLGVEFRSENAFKNATKYHGTGTINLYYVKHKQIDAFVLVSSGVEYVFKNGNEIN